MTYQKKRSLSWLIAAAMTAAAMLFVLLCTDMRYAVNDDAGILRAFLGAESGEPASFHIYIHGILAWPLCLLSNLFPGLPWFSYAQLALLGLSMLVIAKSLMQCFVNHQRPLWAGALLAAAFLSALCLKYVIRLSFTQTSALLGAAAVLQLFSIRHDKGAKPVILGAAGSAALVACSYALRQITALPVLAFCGLAFVVLYLQHYAGGRRPVRPMVISLVMAAAVMLGLVGVREAEIAFSGAQDYLAWQEANTDVIDFYGLSNVPGEAFEMVGWDEATVNLASKWCFLDSDLSTEAFLELNEYMEQHDERALTDRAAQAWQSLRAVPGAYPQDMRCMLAALAAGAAALVCALLRRRWAEVFGVLAAVLGSAAMLFYLGLGGRMPLRAVLMVALPAAAVFFALLPGALPAKLNAPVCVCVAALAVWGVCAYLPDMLIDPEESDLGNAMGDLEEYALFEPESLFIYDDTLVGADLRVFPDYSEGVPDNITFWGGWGLRSPENKQLFERFGIDLDDFDPRALLRDDVYYAAGCIDPPPTAMMEWLESETGSEIDYEIYSEYGFVYIFHFYEY